MSKLYQDNKNEFMVAYLLHKVFNASFTSLEAIVPASRKVISKVFNNPSLVEEMRTIALSTESIRLPVNYILTLTSTPITFSELVKAAFCGETLSNATSVEAKPTEAESEIAQPATSAAADEDEISYVVTKASIVLTKGNETRTVKKDFDTYEDVKRHIMNDELDDAWEMSSPREALLKVTKGNVEIEGNTVKFKGLPMRNEMANRIVSLINKNGAKYAQHLANFADKCMENPSFRAVNELLGFMEKNTLPITPDGDFLAYKKVGRDFYDIHSRTVLNKPAALMSEAERERCPINAGKNDVVTEIVDGVTVVSMPRNMVDDNYENTCSNGLHVCGYDYLSYFGDNTSIILVCKVNPRDVVSVPRDYNDQKMRTCRYEIVKTISHGEQVQSMFVDAL